jgi:cytochrome P450
MSQAAAETTSAITAPGIKWAPGPRGLGLLGAMRRMARDPLRFYSTLRAEYGDVVGAKLGPLYACMAFGAEGVGHVLQERHAIYHKDNLDYRLLRPLLGNGLVTSNGDLWLRQRRLMQPAFHHQRVAGFAPVMTSRTVAMLERWEVAATHREPLDIAREMMRVTLEIVTSVLFGVDVSESAAVIRQALTTVNERVGDMFGKPWMMLPGMQDLPTPGSLRARAAKRRLDAVVQTIVAERRRSGAETGDLLSMLLRARDETGTGMSDGQLRDEVMTMLLAGHETTSTALAWTFYLLARHPEEADKLREELRRILAGRVPTVSDLAQLPYTRMVVEESLRLYPPVWTLSRTPREDDVIGGFHIPAGALVIISPWVTHRHPALWEEPERFDPERFTPSRTATRARFAYIPFAAGPRLCIGEAFAMQEAELVLATVAQRFRLDLVSSDTVEPAPLVTLRPRGGLPMTLTRL